MKYPQLVSARAMGIINDWLLPALEKLGVDSVAVPRLLLSMLHKPLQLDANDLVDLSSLKQIIRTVIAAESQACPSKSTGRRRKHTNAAAGAIGAHHPSQIDELKCVAAVELLLKALGYDAQTIASRTDLLSSCIRLVDDLYKRVRAVERQSDEEQADAESSDSSSLTSRCPDGAAGGGATNDTLAQAINDDPQRYFSTFPSLSGSISPPPGVLEPADSDGNQDAETEPVSAQRMPATGRRTLRRAAVKPKAEQLLNKRNRSVPAPASGRNVFSRQRRSPSTSSSQSPTSPAILLPPPVNGQGQQQASNAPAKQSARRSRPRRNRRNRSANAASGAGSSKTMAGNLWDTDFVDQWEQGRDLIREEQDLTRRAHEQKAHQDATMRVVLLENEVAYSEDELRLKVHDRRLYERDAASSIDEQQPQQQQQRPTQRLYERRTTPRLEEAGDDIEEDYAAQMEATRRRLQELHGADACDGEERFNEIQRELNALVAQPSEREQMVVAPLDAARIWQHQHFSGAFPDEPQPNEAVGDDRNNNRTGNVCSNRDIDASLSAINATLNANTTKVMTIVQSFWNNYNSHLYSDEEVPSPATHPLLDYKAHMAHAWFNYDYYSGDERAIAVARAAMVAMQNVLHDQQKVYQQLRELYASATVPPEMAAHTLFGDVQAQPAVDCFNYANLDDIWSAAQPTIAQNQAEAVPFIADGGPLLHNEQLLGLGQIGEPAPPAMSPHLLLSDLQSQAACFNFDGLQEPGLLHAEPQFGLGQSLELGQATGGQPLDFASSTAQPMAEVPPCHCGPSAFCYDSPEAYWASQRAYAENVPDMPSGSEPVPGVHLSAPFWHRLAEEQHQQMLLQHHQPHGAMNECRFDEQLLGAVARQLQFEQAVVEAAGIDQQTMTVAGDAATDDAIWIRRATGAVYQHMLDNDQRHTQEHAINDVYTFAQPMIEPNANLAAIGLAPADPPMPVGNATVLTSHLVPTEEQLLEATQATQGLSSRTSAAAIMVWSQDYDFFKDAERWSYQKAWLLEQDLLSGQAFGTPADPTAIPVQAPAFGAQLSAFGFDEPDVATAGELLEPLVPQTLPNHSAEHSGFVRMRTGTFAAWQATPLAQREAEAQRTRVWQWAEQRNSETLQQAPEHELLQVPGGQQLIGGIPTLQHTHFSPIKDVYIDGHTFYVNSKLPVIEYRQTPNGGFWHDGQRYMTFVEPCDDSDNDDDNDGNAKPDPNNNRDGGVFRLRYRVRDTDNHKACQTSDTGSQMDADEIDADSVRNYVPAANWYMNVNDCLEADIYRLLDEGEQQPDAVASSDDMRDWYGRRAAIECRMGDGATHTLWQYCPACSDLDQWPPMTTSALMRRRMRDELTEDGENLMASLGQELNDSDDDDDDQDVQQMQPHLLTMASHDASMQNDPIMRNLNEIVSQLLMPYRAQRLMDHAVNVTTTNTNINRTQAMLAAKYRCTVPAHDGDAWEQLEQQWSNITPPASPLADGVGREDASADHLNTTIVRMPGGSLAAGVPTTHNVACEPSTVALRTDDVPVIWPESVGTPAELFAGPASDAGSSGKNTSGASDEFVSLDTVSPASQLAASHSASTLPMRTPSNHRPLVGGDASAPKSSGNASQASPSSSTASISSPSSVSSSSSEEEVAYESHRQCRSGRPSVGALQERNAAIQRLLGLGDVWQASRAGCGQRIRDTATELADNNEDDDEAFGAKPDSGQLAAVLSLRRGVGKSYTTQSISEETDAKHCGKWSFRPLTR